VPLWLAFLTYSQLFNSLSRWSSKWLLKLNPSKCKVMHIGHSLGTVYCMNDDSGNSTIIQRIAEEKGLGVHLTDDLNPSTQRVRSAAKARSVMGMVKRDFRRLDQPDFLLIYKTYIRPRMEYCVQAWSTHLKKRKRMFREGTKGSDKDGTRTSSLALQG